MPQERTPAEVQAEARSEEARQFIRRVRRVTRRKFTPEKKVRIVLEGFRDELRMSELCRREGIRPNVYYAWLKDFMEVGKARLQADIIRDATQAEVEGLKQENEGLKQLVKPERRAGGRLLRTPTGHPGA
ncbi:MAG: transposase [Dehalococcoidia bacterium]